jgi:putative oxidoreductase
MSLLRTAARTMLASTFVYGGLDQFRNPGPKVPAAEPVAGAIAERVPALPSDTEQLVKINGAVQVGAGLLLATGRFRRLAALTLAGTMLPTTVASRQHWQTAGGDSRAQLVHVLQNVGLLGGLVLSALDTEGEPGLAWRSKHAAERAGLLAEHTREIAGLQAELAQARARARTAEARARVGATARTAKRDVKLARKVGRGAARAAGTTARTARRTVGAVIPG